MILTDGWFSSSVKYRRRSDGKAKNRRVIAGRIVQIVSTCWASVVNREVSLFSIRAVNA